MLLHCLLNNFLGLFENFKANILVVRASVSCVEARGPLTKRAPGAERGEADVVWVGVFEKSHEDIFKCPSFPVQLVFSQIF